MDIDFAGAKKYVFNRLENELPAHLIYHNLGHTKESVLPGAVEFGVFSKVSEGDLLLLKTAAIYHDLGFVECSEGHEDVSVRIAEETLPSFGYNPDQVEVIISTIMATKLPQTPEDFLGRLLADADLEILGREVFFDAAKRLRLELEADGVHQTDMEWYRGQVEFLESHSYFTAAANSLRLEKKRKNLEKLKLMLYELPN